MLILASAGFEGPPITSAQLSGALGAPFSRLHLSLQYLHNVHAINAASDDLKHSSKNGIEEALLHFIPAAFPFLAPKSRRSQLGVCARSNEGSKFGS